MPLGLALLVAATTAAAPPQQTPSPPAAPVPLPEADSSDDITVSALRIPRDKLPTGVYWNYETAFGSRLEREQNDMFVGCAMNWATGPNLRTVLDGQPGSAPVQAAQGIIILKGRACQPGLDGMGYKAASSSILDYGQSPLARAIIVEHALRRYGGDLDLSPQETQDTEVQQRFYEREGPRNRLRIANDWAAFVVSSCLVREQPVYAGRLAKAAPGSDLEKGLLQALVVDGRSCLGKTKRVSVDPTHFRTYIVDAYYRWLVAARNVASLVPADGDAIAAR